jgi:acyl-CoA thioesterase I
MLRFFLGMALVVALACDAGSADGAVLARLNNGEKLILCAIGTSITGDYYDPVKMVGVPSAWFPLLGKWLNAVYPDQVTIYNEGLGGAASKFTPTYTTPGSGIDVQLDRALAHEPDVLFIEFAINDAYTKYGISQDMSRQNLQTLIDRAKAWAAEHHKKIEIIVQTMNNMDKERHPGHGSDLEAYYRGYKEVGAANGLLVIDHYANWRKLYDSQPDHAVWWSYVPDGAHPNEMGAERIILPGIQRALLHQVFEPARSSPVAEP